MKPALAQNVGVDIAKDTLDVAILPAGESFRVANDPGGHRALIKRLGRFEISRIVFEATGAIIACSNGRSPRPACPSSRSIPSGRRFAEATGKLAKTDRCDASCWPAWARLELEPPPASKIAQSMKELVSARDALVKDRVAALNRKAVALDPLIKRQLAQRLRHIDGQIQAIDNRLRTLRGSDPDLTLRVDILTSIPGFAEPTANTLVVEAPELGRLDNSQAGSLVGLAPIASDSGQTNRRRSIRGGRPRARRALYMPALSAIRFNPEFKAKYQAMITAGKPPKVAIVAIMRKLFILANALIRDQRKWTPAAP